MPGNITNASGATLVEIHLANNTESDLTSNILTLQFGWCTDTNRFIVKNAGGNIFRVVTIDSSDAASFPGAVAVAGALSVTSTTTASDDILIASGKGLKINSAAADGQFLRGNGTRFVSATLDEKDLTSSKLTLTGAGSAEFDTPLTICNSASPFTVTLPAATGSTKRLTIKNIGAGLITVDGASSETIDGQLTQQLAQYDCMTIIDYVSGAWAII
jgi:hypothetical protein